MKTIKVEYTVREDYVETNKKNITAVMEELRGLGEKGVRYFASLKEDGKTFVHIVVLRDDEAEGVIPNLEAFKRFREGLQTGAEGKPASETMEFVGSSFEFFL